jgi:hypothetical protein
MSDWIKPENDKPTESDLLAAVLLANRLLIERNAKLTAEIERLRKALIDFGSHGDNCPEGSDIGDGMCNCGFSAALVKAAM